MTNTYYDIETNDTANNQMERNKSKKAIKFYGECNRSDEQKKAKFKASKKRKRMREGSDRMEKEIKHEIKLSGGKVEPF